MSLFLHKLIAALFLPVGATGLLLVIGLLRRRRRWIFAALVLISTTSLPVFGDWLLARLELRYPLVAASAVPPADAIVVLSGMLHASPDGVRRPSPGEAFDRFESGLELLRAGCAPRLVFTRGQTPWDSDRPPEGDVLIELAAARGLPRDRLLVCPGICGNTADEAAAIARFAVENRWRRIVLVSSAFHLPRAMLLFEQTGLEVVPFPCDFRTIRDRAPALGDYVPGAEGLLKSERALREFFGYWFYRLRGTAPAGTDATGSGPGR